VETEFQGAWSSHCEFRIRECLKDESRESGVIRPETAGLGLGMLSYKLE
jgi:hypothetical protein